MPLVPYTKQVELYKIKSVEKISYLGAALPGNLLTLLSGGLKLIKNMNF